MYSWTDENGVRHFSNSPPEKNTHETRQTEEYVSHKNEDIEPNIKDTRTPKSTFKENQKEKIKTNRQKKNKSKEVIIYTTASCGYCQRAMAFLNKHGVKYTEYDVRASEKALKEFKRLNGRGVPLILIGDTRITGFNKSVMKSALGIP